MLKSTKKTKNPDYKDYVNFLDAYKNGKKDDQCSVSSNDGSEIIPKNFSLTSSEYSSTNSLNSDSTNASTKTCESYLNFLEHTKSKKFAPVTPKFNAVSNNIPHKQENNVTNQKKKSMKTEIFLQLKNDENDNGVGVCNDNNGFNNDQHSKINGPKHNLVGNAIKNFERKCQNNKKISKRTNSSVEAKMRLFETTQTTSPPNFKRSPKKQINMVDSTSDTNSVDQIKAKILEKHPPVQVNVKKIEMIIPVLTSVSVLSKPSENCDVVDDVVTEKIPPSAHINFCMPPTTPPPPPPMPSASKDIIARKQSSSITLPTMKHYQAPVSPPPNDQPQTVSPVKKDQPEITFTPATPPPPPPPMPTTFKITIAVLSPPQAKPPVTRDNETQKTSPMPKNGTIEYKSPKNIVYRIETPTNENVILENGMKTRTLDRNDPLVKKIAYGAMLDMYGAYHNKANDYVATLPRNMVKKENGLQDIIKNIAAQGGLDKLSGRANVKVETE